MKITKKQQEIIDATLDILETEGLEKVTMKQIARRINVTDGALYNHFQSKEEIFSSIHTYLKEIYENAMERIHQNDDLHTHDYMKRLISLYQEHFFADPRLVFLIRNYPVLFKNYPSLMDDMQQTTRQMYSLFTERIHQGIAAGHFPPGIEAEYLLTIINGAYMALYLRLIREDRMKDVAREGEKLWQQLALLLGASRD